MNEMATYGTVEGYRSIRAVVSFSRLHPFIKWFVFSFIAFSPNAFCFVSCITYCIYWNGRTPRKIRAVNWARTWIKSQSEWKKHKLNYHFKLNVVWNCGWDYKIFINLLNYSHCTVYEVKNGETREKKKRILSTSSFTSTRSTHT